MAGVKGRSGRRPKPTRLKLIQGNPGRRPLRPDWEPQVARSLPSCPSHLGADAQREWARVAPELFKLGLLTELDRAALAAYCSSWGHFVELQCLRKERPERWGPALDRAERQMLDLVRRFAIEFGMSPASRARVKAVPLPEAVDPFEELLSS